MTEQHDEVWLLKKGWKKIEGVKLDHSFIDESCDYSFWRREDVPDFMTPCTFYSPPDAEEYCTEDVDEAIDKQEEWDEYEEIEKEEENDKNNKQGDSTESD